MIALKYQPFNTNSQTHVTILVQHLQGRSHDVYKDGKIGDSSNQNGEKKSTMFPLSIFDQMKWMVAEGMTIKTKQDILARNNQDSCHKNILWNNQWAFTKCDYTRFGSTFGCTSTMMWLVHF